MTHKIRGVPKEVCTCEQKVAYNLAFRCHINHSEPSSWKRWELDRDIIVQGLAIEMMYAYQHSYDYKPRYNDAVIKDALLAGLGDYMEHPFVASDYETIGKAFPIPAWKS